MTTRHAAIAAAVMLVISVGCSGDDGQPSANLPSTIASTVPAPASDLPPARALDLESYYGDELAAIGLRLTDRGGLIDRRGGGYQSSAAGRHLALYVEPIDERTMPEYIDGIRSVTAILAGDLFARWPALESFDVCQEPTTADDPQAEPLPVTQIEMTREQAAAIDFDTVTVTDLLRASQADPPGLGLRVSGRVAAYPAYRALVAEATG